MNNNVNEFDSLASNMSREIIGKYTIQINKLNIPYIFN